VYSGGCVTGRVPVDCVTECGAFDDTRGSSTHSFN
jgi:hypothetical protein